MNAPIPVHPNDSRETVQEPPGGSDGDSGPADSARLLESIINQIIASIAPGNPEQPDSPEGEKLTLPTGEVPIPSPDDPRYPLVLLQAMYRQVYWIATGHSPIGKVVHHAIEQAILEYQPELFDQILRDSAENLRGFWLNDNDEIHLSAIRRAWNTIYKILDIDPRKDRWSPVPEGRILEVIQGVSVGVLLIDILFGEWMVPVPDITRSGLARDILRSLGATDEAIGIIGKTADPDDLLVILEGLFISWDATVRVEIQK